MLKDSYISILEKKYTLKFNRDKRNKIYGVFYWTEFVVVI